MPVIDRAESDERFEQPPGSSIKLTEAADSLTFEVPPAGLRRGTAGLFGFACIWLAFTAVFTSAAVWSLLFGGPVPAQGQAFAGGVAAAMFSLLLSWAIGIGMMVAALHMARHRAAIAVAGDRLLVVQMGLFGEQKRVWERDELQSIQVGPSGVEINDQPALELELVPKFGGKFGLLAGGEVEELKWLATRLGTALHLAPPKEIDLILADVETRPANSSAVVDEVDGVLTISVPPADWRKSLPGGIISIGSDRAEFAFAGGRLLVLQSGWLGKARHEWAAGDLAAIRASARDGPPMGKLLMRLEIVPLAGKPVKLLTGRDDQELAWIATLLRRATGVPAETTDERGDGTAT